jgi:hypothetical protein
LPRPVRDPPRSPQSEPVAVLAVGVPDRELPRRFRTAHRHWAATWVSAQDEAKLYDRRSLGPMAAPARGGGQGYERQERGGGPQPEPWLLPARHAPERNPQEEVGGISSWRAAALAGRVGASQVEDSRSRDPGGALRISHLTAKPCGRGQSRRTEKAP